MTLTALTPRPSTSRTSDAQAPAGLRVRALHLGERVNTADLASQSLVAQGVVATTPLAYRLGQGLVAVFRFGAVVLCGLTPAEEVATLEALAERVVGRAVKPEEEVVSVVVAPDQDEQITANGAIQLKSASPEHLLIVADVLAKSVALAEDEREVADVLDAIQPFARSLALTGSSNSGRSVILRLIGQALLVQHNVAGSVAVREKPDILWDRPDLGRLYNRLEDEYELVERAEAMGRKIEVITASANALINLKDATRSLRLEVIIIVLILAELVVGLVQLFGR
jgi:uncharacterized Rmd1/YagE family protein